MNARIIIPCFFLLFHQLSSAQKAEYAAVDSFISHLELPVKSLQGFDLLIQVVKDKFPADKDRVRAAYYWVTDKIAFDADGYYKGQMITAMDVTLKYKRGNCILLLDYFFNKIGLKSEIVTGIFRHPDLKMQWECEERMNRHTWNAVKLNDEWKLIDATLASGVLSGGGFIKERDDTYFFIDPSILIYTHLPDDTQWQLTKDSIVTMKQFCERPFVLRGFYEAGIRTITPFDLVIKCKPDSVIEFSFTSAKAINTIYISSDVGAVDGSWEVIEKNGIYTFELPEKTVPYGKLFFVFAIKDYRKGRILWKSSWAIGYFFSDRQ